MRYVLVLLLGATVAAFAADMPRAWDFSSPVPARYAAGVDREVAHQGRASGRLRSVGPVDARDFAVLLQTVKADHYLRRRLRVRGWVRTQGVRGWVGLFVRVDPRSGPPLAFDNMQKRPLKGTTPWTSCTIELDVPPRAENVCFGLVLAGEGEAWLDDVTLEAVGPALPGTDERLRLRGPGFEPANLGFED